MSWQLCCLPRSETEFRKPSAFPNRVWERGTKWFSVASTVTNSEMPKPPRHRAKLIVITTAALVLLYVISPYYSLWRFGQALRAHDLAALSARVDFPAVRGSLKQQIRDHFLGVLANKKQSRIAQLLTSSEPSPLDRLIDAYMTPEGLAALISDPAPIKDANSFPSLPAFGGDRKEIDWSKMRHAFFTSPRDFAVDHEGIKLRFRFNGVAWKLHSLDLQLDAPKN